MYSVKIKGYPLAWKDSLVKQPTKKARNVNFSYLIEENKHNPKFLFNNVTRLTH